MQSWKSFCSSLHLQADPEPVLKAFTGHESDGFVKAGCAEIIDSLCEIE